MNNKKNDVILIIIMILIVLVILTGIVFIGIKFFKGVPINSKISTNEVFSKKYEEEIEEININSKAAKIEVKESVSNEIKLVIFDKEDNNFAVENGNKKLEIVLNTEPCNGILCFNSIIPKIELYLPKEYKNKININNKYGDIIIDTFVSKLNVKEDCGDIEIKEVDDLIAKNALGDIKIEKINNSLDVVNNCGDIEINELNIKVDSKIKDDLGNIKIGNTSSIRINAKTDIGDVKLNNNDDSSEITLTIKNDLGDIKINN